MAVEHLSAFMSERVKGEYVISNEGQRREFFCDDPHFGDDIDEIGDICEGMMTWSAKSAM